MAKPAQALIGERQQKKPPVAFLVTKDVNPRTRAALEYMVFQGYSRSEAASAVGIRDETLRQQFQRPAVLAYHRRLLQVLRDSERGRNLHTAIEIRDASLRHSGKTRIEAARFIEVDHEAAALRQAGVTVNVGVGVSIQPGYVMDVSRHAAAAREIMAKAGSVKAIDAGPEAPAVSETARDQDRENGSSA